MRPNSRRGGGVAPAAAPRRIGGGHDDPERLSRDYLAAARANGKHLYEKGTSPMDLHDEAALTTIDLAPSPLEQRLALVDQLLARQNERISQQDAEIARLSAA